MLKRKGVKFHWGPEQQKSFAKLKQMMIATPALHLPDYRKPFFLNCDASQVALGCALGQMHNGSWVSIGYAGRTSNKTEAVYSIYKKEALACVWGCERFKDILADHPFVLRTDNQALATILKLGNKNSLFARWKLRLSQFDNTIEHVRGTQNLCADSLSCMFSENIEDNETQENVGDNQSTTHDTENCLVLSSFPDMFHSLAENQKQDQTLGPIIHKLTQRIQVSHFTLNSSILKFKKNSKSGLKWLYRKICMP